jgi:hypothetical protein
MNMQNINKFILVSLVIAALATISYFAFLRKSSAPGGAADNNRGGALEGNDNLSEGGKAFVDGLEVTVMKSFPVRVLAEISGSTSDACTNVNRVTSERSGLTFNLKVITEKPEGVFCAQVLKPFERTIELDVFALPAGEYVVKAQDKEARFTLEALNILEDKG